MLAIRVTIFDNIYTNKRKKKHIMKISMREVWKPFLIQQHEYTLKIEEHWINEWTSHTALDISSTSGLPFQILGCSIEQFYSVEGITTGVQLSLNISYGIITPLTYFLPANTKHFTLTRVLPQNDKVKLVNRVEYFTYSTVPRLMTTGSIHQSNGFQNDEGRDSSRLCLLRASIALSKETDFHIMQSTLSRQQVFAVLVTR